MDFMHPLVMIIRQIAEAAPNPWYPSVFYRTSGTARDSLDPYLDQLRLGGLIQLTDWVSDTGQGYVMTAAGSQVVQSPRLLAGLEGGKVPLVRTEPVRDPATPVAASSSWERGEAIRAAILTPTRPVATYVLLFANIGWFLAGAVLAARFDRLSLYLQGGDDRILRLTGALIGPLLAEHNEWWRLLTCCFVHIGFIHLAVNMYSLYVVGPVLEQLWGSWRFLILYLVAGLVGSCAMVITNPEVYGAGASGALWGIMASMATWLYVNRAVLPPDLITTWRYQLFRVFIINALITFLIPGISKSAHFGGGAVGLLAAIPLDYLRFGHARQRLIAVIVLLAIPIVAVGWAVRAVHEHARWNDDNNGKQRSELGPQVVKEINQAKRDAEQTLDEIVLPLLEQQGNRRDPAEVKKALTAVEESRKGLLTVQQNLRNEGPYSDSRSEKLRLKAIEYFEVMMTYFRSIEQCLQHGSQWTDQDESTLREQQQHAEELWQALVKSSRSPG
jgi:membrane associated rhomboid family serine protease